MTTTRFLDSGKSTRDFVAAGGELFACAECDALMRPINGTPRGQCTRCAFVAPDLSAMAYFLKVAVVGESLWAVNEAHLAHLKSLVQAQLRRHDVCTGCRPCRRSVADYAPKWLGLAANREPILKAIAKLEEKLANAR